MRTIWGESQQFIDGVDRRGSLQTGVLGLALLGLISLSSPARAADTPAAFFEMEVWAKVGERTCLQCHKPGGDAEGSKFVLRDPNRSQGPARAADMRHNREAFTKMAKQEAKGHQSRILLKVVGKLKHGGKEQLKPDSAEYRLLADFVRWVNSPSSAKPFVVDKNALSFFDGVMMLDNRKLLRRVTLSLAGRLPTKAELAAVASRGLKEMPALLDVMMKEEAFYDRLREGFEDIFLTTGLEETDNSGIPLSYEHFGKTRHWANNKDLVKHIAGEKQRQQALSKLVTDCQKAIRGEPMKLIEHIVRNERPFTEIVTADYIVVTPYSARCYGIYEEVKSRFKNPDDPFEYIPVKLKAQGQRSTDRPYSSQPVDLVKGRTIRFSRNLSLPGGERWPTFPSFLNSNPTCRYPSSLPGFATPGEPTAACIACRTSSSSPCAPSSPGLRTGNRS